MSTKGLQWLMPKAVQNKPAYQAQAESLPESFLPRSIAAKDWLLGVLAFLALMGVTAGVGRLFMGLKDATTLSDGVSWGIWIGFDFGLIAFAGAGFTMAAVVHIFHLEQFHKALRPALLVGLLGYMAVLALLVLDLGRWDRFYHFLLYFNLHSPLFEISWCVLLYSTVLMIEVSPDFLRFLPWKWPARTAAAIIVPVSIIGVTLSTLHQSTLGTLYLNMPYRLHPLWYTPILPILFYVSSIMAGLSLGILAYLAACKLRGVKAEARIGAGLGKGLHVGGGGLRRAQGGRADLGQRVGAAGRRCVRAPVGHRDDRRRAAADRAVEQGGLAAQRAGADCGAPAGVERGVDEPV